MEGLCEDCTKCETRDQTGLISAAQIGHQKCLEMLIQSGADVNMTGEALIEAVREGHVKCVDLLIEAGADVNKQSKDGSTALMLAAQRQHLKCVELLIQSGAEVNKQGDVITFIALATTSGNSDHQY